MIRDSRFQLVEDVRRLVGSFFRPQILRCGLLSALLSVAAFGQCTYTLSPGPKVYVDANGVIDLAQDPLVIQVTASAPPCSNPWTVGSTGFATVASSTGNSGNGSVTLSVPAFTSTTGSARTTPVTIAGVTLTLQQDLTVTRFADVLPNSPEHNFFDGINLLAQKQITGGVRQKQLGAAVVWSRGECYPWADGDVHNHATIFDSTLTSGGTFTYSPTPYFTDVPASSNQFKYIQKLHDLGIAGGETSNTYRPDLPVTREEMAVFITLARLGPNTTFTWSATQQFADVPPLVNGATNAFFKYVQKLAEMGITGGCTAATQTTLADFCPNGAVTRDTMAIFLVVGGFNLLSQPAPLIRSVSPTAGAPPSQTITITGLNTHFSATTMPPTTILPTPGITVSSLVVNSPTSLTVTLTIPSGTPAGPISITAETPLVANGCVTFTTATCEDATAPSGFTIGTGDPAPVISGVTPGSGPIGTPVTITGSTLSSSLGIPATVLVPLQGGGTAAAPVTAFAPANLATSLTFVVPSTAVTGKITVSASSGSA